MHDLLIRNGRIVDGSGGAPYEADIAVAGDHIAAIGRDLGPARRSIDAAGRLVLPGWVDIHTHYDGQATWDAELAPSSWHGVTTAVMGNCGVGFAPVRPGTHDYLIKLMEGVEDIPGTVLWEGIDWKWETFPEFLDVIDRLPKGINYGGYMGHSALRTFAMGERAFEETASEADLRAMLELHVDGIITGRPERATALLSDFK